AMTLAVLMARRGHFHGRVLLRPRPLMSCHHGHFISAKFMKATCFATDRRITCSLRKLKWDCPIALASPQKRARNDLTAVAAHRASALKAAMLLPTGEKFH